MMKTSGPKRKCWVPNRLMMLHLSDRGARFEPGIVQRSYHNCKIYFPIFITKLLCIFRSPSLLSRVRHTLSYFAMCSCYTLFRKIWHGIFSQCYQNISQVWSQRRNRFKLSDPNIWTLFRIYWASKTLYESHIAGGNGIAQIRHIYD